MSFPSRHGSLGASYREGSEDRAISNARLASPIPSKRNPHTRSADISDGLPDPSAPLPSSLAAGSYPKQSQEHSAIAAALSHRHDASPSRSNPIPPAPGQLPPDQRQQRSNYGSFRAGPGSTANGSPRAFEDFDVVRQYLAGPSHTPSQYDGTPQLGTSVRSSAREDTEAPSGFAGPSSQQNEDEFSSLRLLGGDVTREIYRRTEAESARGRGKPARSQSLLVPRTDAEDESLDYDNIHQPGGFRRDHLRRNAPSPKPSRGRHASEQEDVADQGFVSRNFFEFLTIYGHFAGESVDEDEDESDFTVSRDPEVHNGETQPLLTRRPTKPSRKEAPLSKAGTTGTVLILLKSFVGTGVLFLPRAFLNGGMLFSALVLVAVSSISYYCFLLLTTSRLHLKGSYAEMGELSFGKWLRHLINLSLVVSQFGFAAAYIVFTSENLRAFIMAVSHCETVIDMKYMILMQLIIFLPLSLYRNLSNISYVVYVADVFILIGLVYLAYYDIATLVDFGVSDIELFNPTGWTLFIGTAIFTFEGVGLIIPIQDGMKKPQQLPKILGGVMVLITGIFILMGALSYIAFGSKTETVIILNMNQENKFVNGVQFLYSLAILLSTPMQIFPAITILEHAFFTRSGKHSKFVKWRKNLFRFIVVMVATFIAWLGANDLDKFVALVGSFACIPLVYIYPPLIHSTAVTTHRWQWLIDCGLMMLGGSLMVYTTALTGMSWADGSTTKTSPGFCDGK